jgi:DNA-binding transcriptional regulator YhcF (GntR family)
MFKYLKVNDVDIKKLGDSLAITLSYIRNRYNMCIAYNREFKLPTEVVMAKDRHVSLRTICRHLKKLREEGKIDISGKPISIEDKVNMYSIENKENTL